MSKYTCYDLCKLVLKGINKGNIQDQTLLVIVKDEQKQFILSDLLKEAISNENK